MNQIENRILSGKLTKLASELNELGILKERGIGEQNKLHFSFVVYTLQRFLDNYIINEIIDDITDGTHDNNIDIFNIQEEDNDICVNIFQIKYKEKNLNTTIGQNDLLLLLTKIEAIFIQGEEDSIVKNSYLYRKYDEYKSYPIDNIRFKIFLVTNGSDLQKEEQEKIKSFERKHTFFSIEFINNIDFFIEPQKQNNTIKIEALSYINIPGKILSHIAVVKTYELYKLFDTFGSAILDKNVRKLLTGKLNEDIKKSIKNSPDMFFYKNNGISIISKRTEPKEISGKIIFELEDPYIVNGGQTTKLLYNLYKEITDEKERESIFSTSSVLVRIHQTTDDDKINDIVIGTNAQNKITKYDLYSNIPTLKRYKQLFEENNISLVTKKDSEEKKLKQAISSDKLLQIYCSIYQKNPHEAKLSKGLLTDKYYKSVYSNDNIFEELFLSCHVCLCVEKLHRISDKSHSKHSLFSIIFLMSLLNPEIFNSTKKSTEEDMTNLYNMAMERIELIIDKHKNDPNYTHHNFFKSKKSTDAIIEHCNHK